jgi:hypothetical protein
VWTLLGCVSDSDCRQQGKERVQEEQEEEEEEEA